jgi:hypothetical protein
VLATSAETGTTLEVDDTSGTTRGALLREHPSRLGEFAEGGLVRTIVEEQGPGLLRRLGRGVADPSSYG